MKEFNLTEYLKNPSQKVVTRDGREVRIICTDLKNDFPLKEHTIIALIRRNDGYEDIEVLHKNGKFYGTENNHSLDLFFDPIKREGWINLYKDKYEDITYSPGVIHDSEKDAKEAIKCDPDFIATIKIEWEE